MNLAQFRKHALSLEGSSEEPHFDRTSFRVRGKIFATARPTEAHVHVFVGDAVREPALAAHAEVVEKLLWGGKVVGLRVHLPAAPPALVRELLRSAWAERAAKPAPKKRPRP
jgi:hypothetical protein